jgi:hypothetical protein
MGNHPVIAMRMIFIKDSISKGPLGGNRYRQEVCKAMRGHSGSPDEFCRPPAALPSIPEHIFIA